MDTGAALAGDEIRVAAVNAETSSVVLIIFASINRLERSANAGRMDERGACPRGAQGSIIERHYCSWPIILSAGTANIRASVDVKKVGRASAPQSKILT